MRDFNLEEAKAGAPVCTRCGCKARIICFDMRSEYYPIVAIIQYDDGYECVDSFTSDGLSTRGTNSTNDLMMAPKIHEGWVRLVLDTTTHKFTTEIYETKESAEEGRGPKDIVSRIEWEEEQ